jgi:MOSC domain-containing protein YiiM
MVRRFMLAGRTGIYFRVVVEGDVGAGDSVTRIHEEPHRVPVAALVTLLDPATRDSRLAERALRVPALPPQWVELLRATVAHHHDA